ncbi:MAG: hypothetical protein AAFO07_14100 [Bacteroidota bacterium]
MKQKGAIIIGLLLIFVSQLLLSFGYDFLMAQRPVDFAHWSLFLGAILLFGLWFTLPDNFFKGIGLSMMTLGIGGITGMCTIDFILWAAHSNPEVKKELFFIISNEPSIMYAFLVIGPTLFYMGLGISTYGLFSRFKWQVIAVNIGVGMIGLGHMILNNRIVPVVGAVLLMVSLLSIIGFPLSDKTEHQN